MLRWTSRDRAEFARMAANGFDAEAIGKRFGRTIFAVYAFASYHKIGLKKRGSGAVTRARQRSSTYRRLAWVYGPERAAAIVDGKDREAIADQAAWRNLGRRSAA